MSTWVFVTPVGAIGHVVEPGDTLSAIAVAHDVSVAHLVELNDLAEADLIIVGQILDVGVVEFELEPTDPPSLDPAPVAMPELRPASGATYRVNAGDTLSQIAWRLGVTVPSIVALNDDLDRDRLRLGQLLYLPESSEPVSSIAAPARILSDPERMALVPVFHSWAYEYAVPHDLTMALAYVESEWRSDAVSSTGATGVGQLTGSAIEFVSYNLLGLPMALDAMVPTQNIQMTTRYLAHLRQETASDVEALAAYFHGLGTLQESGLSDATRLYAEDVLAWRAHFRGL